MTTDDLKAILRLDDWTEQGKTWTPPAGVVMTFFAVLGAESMTVDNVVSLQLAGDDMVRLATTRKETYTMYASSLAVVRRVHAR